DDLAVLTLEPHGELSFSGKLKVGGPILIAIGVTADDDRLGPTWHEPRDVSTDDRLTENHAPQDVADGTVGRFPHLFEAEFLHALLVGRDRCAFHSDAMLLDGMSGLDSNLVLGPVAVLDRKIVVEKIDVQIGVDKLLLDQGPNNPRHLVAVELDNGILNLDFCHVSLP